MVEHGPDAGRSLPTELQRWVGAGLITEEQAQAISSFEGARSQTEKSGRATRAIALLGGLTLISGVGSLVAYNWDSLTDAAKLLGMAVLLVVALAATLRARQHQRSPVSTPLDVSLVVTSGLTLAGLALVSQVYAQDGELFQLLFAWCAMTAPLMAFSRTRFAHYFWFSGLLLSLMSSGDELSDLLQRALGLHGDSDEIGVVLVFGTLSALVAARFSASRHPGRAAVGLQLYVWHLHALGLFGGLTWFAGSETAPLLWALALVSIGTFAAATPKSIVHMGYGRRRAVLGLSALGIGLGALPLGLGIESGVAAFVSFVLFWSVAWWLAEQAGHVKNARFAVAVLGCRIVIASFELFESMLVTGSVLVAMGVAALLWSKFKWSGESEEAHHE